MRCSLPSSFWGGILGGVFTPTETAGAAVLLVLGMILEPNSAILIVVPVILSAAAAFDIAPIHLGSIIILNLMIGLLTPPVGLVLYVLSSVTHIPFSRVARGTAPFLFPLIIILLLVTFIPGLTMWLPTLFGLA